MVKAKVVIKNPSGLHLRPEAIRYKSSINFHHRHTMANAKSVLSVLGACIKCGSELEFICEGEDEEEALAAIVKIVNDGLGE